MYKTIVYSTFLRICLGVEISIHQAKWYGFIHSTEKVVYQSKSEHQAL